MYRVDAGSLYHCHFEKGHSLLLKGRKRPCREKFSVALLLLPSLME